MQNRWLMPKMPSTGKGFSFKLEIKCLGRKCLPEEDDNALKVIAVLTNHIMSVDDRYYVFCCLTVLLGASRWQT